MFRAAASTLAVFFILLVVLSAGLIQQALEPPLPVGDDGFPHVTMLAVSGWNRLRQEDATKLVVQMGVAAEKLGAALILGVGDTLPAPPAWPGNNSVTSDVFKRAFSKVSALRCARSIARLLLRGRRRARRRRWICVRARERRA